MIDDLNHIPVATVVQMESVAVDLKELCCAFIEMKHTIQEMELRFRHHEKLRNWQRTQIFVLTFAYMLVITAWLFTYLRMTASLNVIYDYLFA